MNLCAVPSPNELSDCQIRKEVNNSELFSWRGSDGTWWFCNWRERGLEPAVPAYEVYLSILPIIMN